RRRRIAGGLARNLLALGVGSRAVGARAAAAAAAAPARTARTALALAVALGIRGGVLALARLGLFGLLDLFLGDIIHAQRGGTIVLDRRRRRLAALDPRLGAVQRVIGVEEDGHAPTALDIGQAVALLVQQVEGGGRGH